MTMLEMARDAGFKGVVANTGSQALELARVVKPDAITLDLRLPDVDGWVLLDRLKHDAATRHIPIHVVSGLDDERRSLQHGALALLAEAGDVGGAASTASPTSRRSSTSGSRTCSSSRTIRSSARRSAI